jgi:hypothetical protein
MARARVTDGRMVLRLGAVTGVGHARLILERFGKCPPVSDIDGLGPVSGHHGESDTQRARRRQHPLGGGDDGHVVMAAGPWANACGRSCGAAVRTRLYES